MDVIKLISDERKKELEKELEQEIKDLKNKIICERKFIYYISKKYKFLEFCYLCYTYVGIHKIIRIPPNISYNESIFEEYTDKQINYNRENKKHYKIKGIKKVKKIEKMSQIRNNNNYIIKRG